MDSKLLGACWWLPKQCCASHNTFMCRAKDHKVKNSYASAVISMSIAGPRSAALNDAVEAAVAAGITVVAAAGEQPLVLSAQQLPHLLAGLSDRLLQLACRAVLEHVGHALRRHSGCHSHQFYVVLSCRQQQGRRQLHHVAI